MNKFGSIRRFLPAALAGSLVIFAAMAPASAWASHFRGGSLSWQSADLDNDGQRNDVRITVKTAWRYDWNTFTADNPVNIALDSDSPEFQTEPNPDHDYIYINGDKNGADYVLQTSIFEAKDLDPNESYLVYYSSNARIAELENNANSAWKIQTEIYLKDGNLAPKIDLPIIMEVPKLQADGTKLQDWVFDLSSTDPNADKLRYRLATTDELGAPASTNPPGFSINPNTGLITWSDSGDMAAGLYSVGIVAEDMDESGNAKSKTHVDLILSLVNKSQVSYTPVSEIPETRNVVVEKGETFSFTVDGTAIDTQSLGDIQQTLTEPTANQYNFTPGGEGTGLDPGSYPIVFEVRDSDGNKSNNYLMITFIVPDPNAPRIAHLEADRVTYSGTDPVRVDKDLDAAVTDADTTEFNGGMLKFNVTFTDGEFEILAIQSTGDGAGQIRVDDSDVYYEGTKFAEISNVLDGVGRALRIDFTESTSIEAVQTLVRSLTYRDTFVLRSEGDRGLSVYLRDPDGRASSYDFFAYVEPHPDESDHDDELANDPPLQAANQITLVEGDAIALSNENINYADPEGDELTLTVSEVNNGQFALVSAPGAEISSFTQHQINLGQIAFVHDGGEDPPAYKISASDGTNDTAPEPGTINFTNVADHVPVITGAASSNVDEGVAYSLKPDVTDADRGVVHQFTIQNKPSWAEFDEDSGELSGTPGFGDAGSYSNIVISVSDGTSSASTPAFTINVENVNRPPTISGDPDTLVAEAVAYSFEPEGDDADGDDLTYSIDNKPDWATFSTTDGTLSGTPDYDDAGTYTGIVISAEDVEDKVSLAAFTITVSNTNRTPTLTGDPNTTVAENSAYNFAPDGDDADGDDLTYSIENRPDWATFSTTDGTLSGTPDYDDAGTYAGIAISAEDAEDKVSLTTFTITVSNTNRTPTLTGDPDTTVAENSAYNFGPDGDDADGDGLTYSIENKPDWASFSTTDGTLSGTPDYDDAGTYAGIVISAEDAEDKVSLATFTITVSNTNRAPTLTGDPETTVAENSAYSFEPKGDDADGDELTYSIVNKPDWATFSTAEGTLSGTPDYDDAGTYAGIVISAEDAEDKVSLAAFTLTVSNTNRAPTLTGTPDTTVAENSAYRFEPNGDDADDDELTYSIENKPDWASFSTTDGTLSGTPDYDDAGAYAGIVISAEDAEDKVSLATFTITVSNTNRAPTLTGAPDTTVAENSAYSFEPDGNDADGDDLTYSIENKPDWATFNPGSGALAGTPDFDDAGTYAGIVISVKDTEDEVDLDTFSIEVTNTNRDPSISGTPVGTVAEDDLYRFKPDAEDDDTGDTLTFIVTGNPDWLEIDATSGELSGTPDFTEAGTYENIVVTVTDDKHGSDSLAAFTIEVTNINREPSISGTPAGTVAEDEEYGFKPRAEDPDTDDTHTFSVTGNPHWLTINTETGELSGTPGFSDATTYENIVVTVSDDKDGSDSLAPFAIEVTNTNREPDADEQSLEVIKNIRRTITLRGADADRDVIEYVIVDEPQQGVLEGEAPNLVFIPEQDFVGDDSFTFKVKDDHGDESGVATVFLSVLADADDDGLPDVRDPDSGNWDTDGDDIPDGADVDVDGDGTPDNGTDADGDGVNDDSDVDSTGGNDSDEDGIDDHADPIDDTQDIDNDGLSDEVDPDSGNFDTDGDGIPDGADVDADGDGTPDNGSDVDGDGINDEFDVDQTGGTDSDGDGIDDDKNRIDNSKDSDDDGLPDSVDPDVNNPDTDGDGIPDGADVDIDGDGTNDNGTDTDGDGVNDHTEGTGDADGDGTPNYRDTDSDGDGIPDSEEGAHDLDGDGVTDYLDTDSDGDGIPDADEGTGDTNDDGVPDYRDTDSDGDGIPDADEGTGDTDEDGVPDYRDTDSDGDGIPDAGEGAADTDGDGAPNYRDEDSDGDGIADSEEGTADTDGDGVPDYRDEDSDGDGLPDRDESTGDTDGDGIADHLDSDADGDGIPDNEEGFGDFDGDGVPDYLDIDSDGDGKSDAEESSTDTDGDGTPNYLDTSLDEDGDGILDIIEGTEDVDGDGIANFLDVDSDGDGIPDILEAPLAVVLTGMDSDQDGIDDALDVDLTGGDDANGNGIDDVSEPVDTDGDQRADYLDIDSDGDRIPDRVEADTVMLVGNDSDGDGIDDFLDVDHTGGTDLNGDGVDDEMGPRDTDRDGTPNHLDLDSDNDGIRDSVEGGAVGIDSDGDGIDDAFDADKTGGTSADGIDAAGLRDSDGDRVPDAMDLDSDNDSISDVLEAGLADDNGDGFADDGITTGAPKDTDQDGVADYLDLDLDSDGTGTNDIDRAGYGFLDLTGDGRIDDATDQDGDGVADVVDNEIGQFGGMLDTDGDTIPNSVDLDDDNDGIPDAEEGNADTDGDGLPDRLDLDSDNDGILDLLEGTTMFTFDTGDDGVIDAFADTDGDGLHDAIDSAMRAVDTDGDGIADFRDLDSDGDGAWDLAESGTDLALDTNNDGRIDVFIDVDRDGMADSVDGRLAGNQTGVVSPMTDSDGDGVADFRDTDSDNDGFPDELENGDFDGDGVADGQQNKGSLKTAVTGGGGSAGLGLLGLLVGAVVWRRLAKNVRNQMSMVAVAMVLIPWMHQARAQSGCGSDTDGSFERCWYLGAGVALGHLEPEGQLNGWSTDDPNSQGFSLQAGQLFRPHWFWELSYLDAGEAGLGNVNPAVDQAISDAAVSYVIPSLMVGYLLWDKGDGFNLYAKAGASTIRTEANDSRIGLDPQTSTQIALGAGALYSFAESPWIVSLDLSSYDRDARVLGLKVSRTFGGRSRAVRSSESPAQPEPVQAVAETPEQVECATDCAGLQDIEQHILFALDQAGLTEEARGRLNEVAALLEQHPNVAVEVIGHTDDQGSARYNLRLSQKRSAAVAQYLTEQGIATSRLTAIGRGEEEPVADNGTEKGRAKNRRVVFEVLD